MELVVGVRKFPLVILSGALCREGSVQLAGEYKVLPSLQDGCRLWLELVMAVPLLAKVLPRRIYNYDKRNLLDPQPALDSLFPLDRVANIFEAFELPGQSSLYFAANRNPVPVLCSRTLRMRLFVTPV